MKQNNIDPEEFIDLFTDRENCCQKCFLREVCIWKCNISFLSFNNIVLPRDCFEMAGALAMRIKKGEFKWKMV